MANNLDNHVTVVISLVPGGLSNKGFGLPLIAAPHTRFQERFRRYADIDAVAEDFLIASAVHQAANSAFAQEPKPPEIAVGRQLVNGVFVVIDTVADDTDYTVTINGTAFTIDSGTSATEATIITALQAAIAAGSEPVTAVDLTTALKITNDSPEDGFSLEVTTNMSATDFSAVVDIDTVTDSIDYTVTINGVPFTINSGVSATTASIITALAAAINAGAEPVVAIDNTTDLQIHSETGERQPFTATVTAEMSVVLSITEDIQVALGKIEDENNQWYGLATTYRAPRHQTIVEGAVTWAEARIKLHATASADPDIKDSGNTTNIASVIELASRRRSFVFLDDQADGGASDPYPEMAIFAARLATIDLDVETATWKFARLSGITTVALNDTQRATVIARNVMFVEEVGGGNITVEGKVGEGEWIDVIVGRDWLKVRMQERIFESLSSELKVGFDDEGIDKPVTAMKTTLQIGLDTGFLFKDLSKGPQGFGIGRPLAADVPDRSTRDLSDLTFDATILEAIHTANVRGRLSR